MLKHQPRNILITGGAGFIGCNFVRYVLANTSARVVNLDALTYAGNLHNLTDVENHPRYRLVHGNINNEKLLAEIFASEKIDTVVHLAAESHVDRSINAPAEFLQTNIFGTYHLLQAARTSWQKRDDVRFHHVSTDEVYGSLGANGLFHETTAYDPSSPYSASKAASDHLIRAWARTFNLPVTISNCSNNYGEYQFPEKLIPLMIMNALSGIKLPVYGRGENIRDWLYVGDHCAAIWLILTNGENERSYNIGGQNEWKNLDLVHLLCDTLQELSPKNGGHYRDLITFVTDRLGHDLRYAIDATRIRDELGWRAQYDFKNGLRKTIQWYLNNQEWCKIVREGVAPSALKEKNERCRKKTV